MKRLALNKKLTLKKNEKQLTKKNAPGKSVELYWQQ